MSRSARGSAAAAAVLATLLSGAAAAQTWRPLGPAPIDLPGWSGRAAALAVSPERADAYWVGTASGGVWQTRNGGRAWKERNRDLPTLALGALAVDPKREKTIYAGSGEANYAYHSLYGLGLYRSTDGGRRWTVLAAETFAGRTFSRIVVSPADGDRLWAAVARAGGTRRGNEGARGHPRRNGPQGVFRSTDGGESWKRLRKGLPKRPASDLDLDPTRPERLFASVADVFGHRKNGVYRSEDGGDRWQRLPIGLAGREIGRISLAIAPSDPDRVYALVARPATSAATGGFAPDGAETVGVLRSDDGGDTWRLLDAGNPQACCGQYFSAIGVDPGDPDVVLVGGLNLILSRDGGLTWRDVTPPHVDIHDLAFDAAGRLLAATDGGVYRSDDLGSSWRDRNRRLGTVQYYPGLALDPSRPEVALGGTQDNGSTLRLPSGEWIAVFGGDGGWCLIHPTDPSVLFVQAQGVGNIFRSSDGGRSFSQVAVGIDPGDRTAFQAPLLFDPQNPGRLLTATQRVYESVDGGFTWRPLGGDLAPAPWAVRSLAVAPSNSDALYAVTSDGGVHASRDGGATWTRSLTDLAGWPRIQRQVAVDPGDDRRAFLAEMTFGGRGVLETTDGGASWHSIAGDLPDVPVATVAVHRDGEALRLFAGTDAGVYLTEDGGASWRRWGDGLPNAPTMDLVVDAERGRLVASTLGRGLWEAELRP